MGSSPCCPASGCSSRSRRAGSSAAASSPATADEYLRRVPRPGHRLGWRAFAGADRRRRGDARLGCADGAGRSVAVHRGDDRRRTCQRRAAAAVPRRRPPGAARRRRGGRRRRDLQGAGHGRGVRARGAVPRRPRPADAAPGARRQRHRLPRVRRDQRHRRRCSRSTGTPAFGLPRPRRRGRSSASSPALGARGFGWLLRRGQAPRRPAHARCSRPSPAGAPIAVLFAIGRRAHRRVARRRLRATRCSSGSPTRRGRPWLLLAVLVLRSLATSATVAGGGVGGLFVPLVVAGALDRRARRRRRQPRRPRPVHRRSASPRSSAPATGCRSPR